MDHRRVDGCPCHCLINTALSAVYVNYDMFCTYSFGSVYYNSHNAISIKDWPREPLMLNPKALSLLQDVVASSSSWYKMQMISKIIVVKHEADEDSE